jgi:hypothetical protein
MDNSPKRQSSTVLNTIVSYLLCTPIKSKITNENGVLKISTAGKIYNWYDCSDNFISTKTTNDFKPDKNGKYYAIVEGDRCNYITECFNYVSTPTIDIDLITNVSISPNPSQAVFTMDKEVDNYTVRNVYGQVVKKGINTSLIDMTSMGTGVYYVEINIGRKNFVKPIIKVD